VPEVDGLPRQTWFANSGRSRSSKLCGALSPFSCRNFLFDAKPMKSVSVPVQKPSVSLYCAGMSPAAGDLYGMSKPSAFSVSIDGRPMP
jgi:hypothetical protein